MLQQVSLQVSTLIKPRGSEEFLLVYNFLSFTPLPWASSHCRLPLASPDLAALAPVSECRVLSVVTTLDLATASGQITQPRASTPASTSEVSGNYNRTLG